MAREIRKLAPKMPVLFMSGYAEEQLRREIDIEGMHFIPKPFSVRQIAAKVGQVLAGSGRGDKRSSLVQHGQTFLIHCYIAKPSGGSRMLIACPVTAICLARCAGHALAQAIAYTDSDRPGRSLGDDLQQRPGAGAGRAPVAIAAGRSRIAFPDVSAQIRPETLSFAAPDTGIVEQNFDFDLLTPAKLMEKAIGQTVTLLRTNPGDRAGDARARDRALHRGGVVVQIGDRIEVLRDDGLPVR